MQLKCNGNIEKKVLTDRFFNTFAWISKQYVNQLFIVINYFQQKNQMYWFQR